MKIEMPKRPKQHISETKSYKILNKYLPDEWVVRSITEKDYGVDLYIEIVEDNLLTGKLFTCQIKGINKITNLNNIVCYDIKPSTFNYWHSLPTTTFIFYVDETTEDTYFLNIKDYIRKHYKIFQNGDLKKVIFNKKFNLKNLQNRIAEFITDMYDIEDDRKRYEEAIIDFIVNFEDNLQLLEDHYSRDRSMALCDENYDDYKIILLYQNYRILCFYLGIAWKIKTIKEMISDGQKMFNREGTLFFEAQVSEFVKNILPIKKQILEKLYSCVCGEEKEYWEQEAPLLMEILFETFSQRNERLQELVNI